MATSEIAFDFDEAKAIETMLYVAKRISRSDKYKICKMLYLADKTSLAKYGRFIFGESYSAMQQGATPSRSYDILKGIAKESSDDLCVEGNAVAAQRDANLDYFSESDIECLDLTIATYDKNPQKFPDAKPIHTLFEITDSIIRNAGGKGSIHSTGGMKTKLEAAKIASNAGCRIVLANGRLKNVIGRIMTGEEIGTIFMPKRKLSNRSRWILNSAAAGTINIDDGAMRAIRNHKSLLPSGVISVQGSFNAGSVVMLNDNAKAVTSLSNSELKALAGKHSTEIKKLLGPKHRDVVAIPEDIVVIDT